MSTPLTPCPVKVLTCRLDLELGPRTTGRGKKRTVWSNGETRGGVWGVCQIRPVLRPPGRGWVRAGYAVEVPVVGGTWTYRLDELRRSVTWFQGPPVLGETERVRERGEGPEGRGTQTQSRRGTPCGWYEQEKDQEEIGPVWTLGVLPQHTQRHGVVVKDQSTLVDVPSSVLLQSLRRRPSTLNPQRLVGRCRSSGPGSESGLFRCVRVKVTRQGPSTCLCLQGPHSSGRRGERDGSGRDRFEVGVLTKVRLSWSHLRSVVRLHYPLPFDLWKR